MFTLKSSPGSINYKRRERDKHQQRAHPPQIFSIGMSKGSLVQRSGRVNFLMSIDKKKPKSNLGFINGSTLIPIFSGTQRHHYEYQPEIQFLMNKIQSYSKLKLLGVLIYLALLVLISLYVFVANGETAALSKILELNYLIPVLIYSSAALWFSYFLFLLLGKFLNKIISFPISLIIGIPVGIVLISLLFGLTR